MHSSSNCPEKCKESLLIIVHSCISDEVKNTFKSTLLVLKILAPHSIFEGNKMGVNCLLNKESWIILSSDCQVEVDEVELTT